ncbi:hypothetical protein [Mycolicibacterium tusciae]|uniref:hypothetical protein n=1 Tax=Mycolicibacterium tusciae TaxID=75922 RepID=UPI00024A5044|nr:hypothetical protein [Mycolicibacterium tusciae]
MDGNTGDELGKAIGDLVQASMWAVVVYWFLSAVVAGAIAGDRNRSFVGWFFATFLFLGPLGVGFALIAPRGGMGRLLQTPPPTANVPASSKPKKAVAKSDPLAEAEAEAEAAQQRAKAARARAEEMRRRAEKNL